MTAARPIALSAENVAKVFKTRHRPATVAVADVSVDVREGEFLILLGASGCGKTTLLRMFAGLETPSSGKLSLFGQPIGGPSAQAAMLFQSPVLLPWRTILQNVMLPVEVRRAKGDDYRARALELLRATGLEEFANHYPRELSGGMRQRVAICRALVLDPPVLFMDEPFGALDAMTRATMNHDLWETWRHTGKTIVFVTHDITEAVRLGSRVIVMTPRPGRIAQTIDIEIDAGTYQERIEDARFLEHFHALQQAIESSGAGVHPLENAVIGA